MLKRVLDIYFKGQDGIKNIDLKGQNYISGLYMKESKFGGNSEILAENLNLNSVLKT